MINIRMFFNGGMGDWHSGVARIPNIKLKHPDSKLYLYGTTCKPSEHLVVWLLDRYKDWIEEAKIISFDRSISDADIIEYSFSEDDLILRDWCDVDGKQFEISYPFITRTNNEFYEMMHHKTCGIHMLTTQGDMDFKHTGGFNPRRYWSRSNWATLIQELIGMGYKIKAFGAENEDYKLDLQNFNVENHLGENLDKVVSEILHCDLFIGTNSWLWQISAYAGIPTIVLYFTNTGWIPIHYNENMIKSKIFEDRDVNPDVVLKSIAHITNDKL